MTKIRYSEIEIAGGLISALNFAFKKMGSELRVSNEDDPNFFPGAFAQIEKNNKLSQIYIASEEKLYLPDFWRDGVCLANGGVNDIDLLVECIDYWLNSQESTKQLANKFSFVTPYKNAAVFDEGKEVEYAWKLILNSEYSKEIRSFVELAINDEILSKLYPFTSLMTLCFSRCTGYPYTGDTPTITPIFETDRYLVRNSDGDEIGSGSASEALKMVLCNLPTDIGPAVKGTADDL